MRWALVAVVVALVAGCGGGSGASPELSPLAVHEAPDRVRAQGTFAFTAAYVRQVPGKPDEEYLQLEGAVDVRQATGRLEADLSAVFAGAPPSESTEFFEKPIELRWTRDELVAAVGGKEQSQPRDPARESGGLLGRLPDEPAALVELLGHADGVRRLGKQEIDDRATVRFSFSVEARRAGAAGVPAELATAFAQAAYGPRLQLEAWLDADGLPRRIEYVVRLRPVRSAGKQILPARVVRGTYELSEFGADIATSR